MLVSNIQNDLKQAQLQRDELKVSVLRMLLSEIHNSEITKGIQLTDAEAIVVIQKEVKKRKEAAAGFRQGGREESAVKEEQEAKILEGFLPAQMSDEELTKVVEDSIKEIGANNIADMGRVIGLVMSKVAGQAEGSRVSSLVREKLLG